eukprot:COSAG02_NODE_3975_length_5965_cov_5.092226_2_plen_122_part_00
MSNYTLETYSNENVIKVNQDALGVAGERIVGADLSQCIGRTASCTNVWSKPLGSYADGEPAAAMVFINVGGSVADVHCDTACWAKAGFAGETLRRLCMRVDLILAPLYSARVRADLSLLSA